MALVFRSNIAYTGPVLLPSVEAIAYTPSQLYDIYAARVDADGGSIISESRTLAAITYLQEQNLYGRLAVCAAPAWGVKLDTGRVEKMYSLTGIDMEGQAIGVGGTLPLHATDSDDNPVVVGDINASRVGGFLRTVSAFALAKSVDQWAAIITCQNDLDSLAVQTFFGNLASAGIGYAPVIFGRTPASGTNQTNWLAQRSDYDPAAAADAGTRMSGSGSRGAADAVGTALALRVSSGDVRLFNNGSQIGNAISGTGALYDYTALERRLTMPSGFDGSANITASRKGHIREVMVLRQGTLAEIAALTAQLTAWNTP